MKTDPQQLERVYRRMLEWRRELHRHPELAFQEAQTATIIVKALEHLGIDYEYPGVGHAVIGKIVGDGAGPSVALRAEMDALPGREDTGLPFSAIDSEVVHACGHDAHMAMVLGAAMLLSARPPEGEVVLVFQPAEESGGGSRVALKSALLDNVRSIFGGHVTHHYHVGEIMLAEGTITAQSDRFRIEVRGKGGHGARPHEAIDAVVIAGLLIVATQTLVSREIDPVHPSVVTIGTIRAGSAPNVIAAQAVLEGSIRSTVASVRTQLHQGLQRIADALGDLHNAEISVEIEEGYPPVVNTPLEVAIARRAANTVVGEAGLMQMDHPSMGSEDFSYFLEKLPGCYVRFGARSPGQTYVPLHSPTFDIDEQVLKVGAAYFEQVVREAIGTYRNDGNDIAPASDTRGQQGTRSVTSI